MTSKKNEKKVSSDLISSVGMRAFAPNIRNEVDGVLATGQSLEPATRQRFVEAAHKSVELNARAQRALEVSLFHSRRDLGVDLSAVASSVGADADSLRSIEKGDTSLTSLEAGQVAAWILQVKIEPSVAESALRRTLISSSSEPAYRADADMELGAEPQKFLDAVMAEIARLGGGSPSD